MRRALVGLALAVAAACGAHAEPDAEALGAADNYPLGSGASWYDERYRVGSWSALHRVPGIHTRIVPASAQSLPLPAATHPPALGYRYRNLGYTLQDYLDRQRITGLLVLKDGAVVAEHYRYGRKAEDRFLSFSMAKSVTALLVGAALERGVIASLEDPAEKYASSLAGTAYGATRIIDLLRMSSGLTFTERYDGQDDIARMGRAMAVDPSGSLAVVRTIRDRHSAPGTVFRYASAETDVLGRVLVGAAGRDLSQLTAEWLWQPLGAEQAAAWRVGVDGQEAAHGFFNATLRDWGRLGVLLARDGRIGERQVIPREYLLDATDPDRQPPAFRPRRATPYLGYGYQFWLLPMRTRTFVLQGVHGQALYVQPASGIVMVQTAVYRMASGMQDPQPFQERDALWRGVLQSLGGHVD